MKGFLNKPELLAPAGSMESIYAAVRCGADAVYVGGAKFSARANATNFTDDELEVARNFVINSYRSYKDSPYSMKEYYRSGNFSKNSDTIDEAIAKVQKINRNDVMTALSGVRLNTVYFLKGKEA